MENKASDFQTLFKQHIHENLLLREQNRNLETIKATKLRELNTAEANFKSKYKKYIKLARKPSQDISRQLSSPVPEVSPRPPFIICKDFPYSFKTWGNLTDLNHEKEGIDVYKTELLECEENMNIEHPRRRSFTSPPSQLASKISNFRKKRKSENNNENGETNVVSDRTQSAGTDRRERSKSISNLKREKIEPNIVKNSKSGDSVATQTTYALGSRIPGTPPFSYAALLRCPERVSKATIPSITLTTELGEELPLVQDDTNLRKMSVALNPDDIPRLDLLLRRRKSWCVTPSNYHHSSSTEALKTQVGLGRLLRTSTHLSASFEYIDKINGALDGRNLTDENFEELKKCRYLRNPYADEKSGEYDYRPGIQSLIMPPISRQSFSAKRVQTRII